MSGQQDPIAVAQAAIKAAEAIVATSQALVSEAHQRFMAEPPTLTADDFAKVANHHATIAAQAAKLQLTVAIDIGGEIQADIDKLNEATDALNAHIASLSKVQDVIGKVTQVLVTAGSLLTFVAAPSATTLGAVVTAVVTLAK